MVEYRRNVLQQLLSFASPDAPIEEMRLDIDTQILRQLKALNARSIGSPATAPIIESNTSTLLIVFPPWLYPTINSQSFYERNANNIQGVVSGVITSALVTIVNVPNGYVGFLWKIATDDNTSTFHQYVIDGQLDTTFSGLASPQGTEAMLEVFPPLRFKKSLAYYASNFNTSTVTYQGILQGWITPRTDVEGLPI